MSTASLGCTQESVNICNKNCKDHLYTSCESEVLYDCGCSDDRYIDEDGFCVPQNECGCYDFSEPQKYIRPGDEISIGCMKW